MRNLYMLFVGLLVPIYVHAAVSMQRPLNNPIITLLDGVAFDGMKIRDMSFIRRTLRKIQFGVYDMATSSLHGKYIFLEKNYTLHALAEYQKELEQALLRTISLLDEVYVDAAFASAWTDRQGELGQEQEHEVEEQQKIIENTIFDGDIKQSEKERILRTMQHKYAEKSVQEKEALKKQYIVDTCMYERQTAMLYTDYQVKMQALLSCLPAVKHDVIMVFKPFAQYVMKTKMFMRKLIEEFCQKRGRMDSFLLEWIHIQDDQEMIAVFEKSMNTFIALDAFCTDLAQFLKDVIDSCPKGWQQFLVLSQQNKKLWDKIVHMNR